MACYLCFGSRTGRNMKVKEKSDEKSRRDKSSSSAKPGRGLLGSDTLQESDNQSQMFSYLELATATNNFKMESLIGRGGFGTVYKGRIESKGHNIAVKMLDKSGVQGDREFLVEVLMLSLLRHENLVRLLGYCAEGDQRLLVYEYMPLGSVEDHIHDLSGDQEALDWNTRMQIAAGAAKGLEYLHNKANPPVIYRDLKTSNILLDHLYKPKLSDFGLAKFGPSGDMSHVSTRVMGTHGYCAPEYANSGKLTLKSDIYSFGVVMLELITGRKALMNSSDCVGASRFLVNWAHTLYLKNEIKQIVDPTLSTKAGYSGSTVKRALDVAFMCLREDANARPSISEVVSALDYIVKCNQGSRRRKERAGLGGGGGGGGDLEKTVNEEVAIEDIERERAVAEAMSWAKNFGELRSPSTDPPTPSPTKC